MEEILINQRTVRFSKAPWYKPEISCIIGGLGGIGSYLSFYLARQDAELYIYDFDTIEESNLGGQFYNINDISSTKEKAVKHKAEHYSDNKKVYTNGKYTKDSLYAPYMFSCFDSLEARKIMFENWLKNFDETDEPCIFIDGRMSMEDCHVFFVTKDRIQKYKDDLYSDTEILPLPCNMKSTSHCGAICAGLMVSGFNNFISNIHLNADVREVPFRINVSLSEFNFDIYG